MISGSFIELEIRLFLVGLKYSPLFMLQGHEGGWEVSREANNNNW